MDSATDINKYHWAVQTFVELKEVFNTCRLSEKHDSQSAYFLSESQRIEHNVTYPNVSKILYTGGGGVRGGREGFHANLEFNV